MHTSSDAEIDQLVRDLEQHKGDNTVSLKLLPQAHQEQDRRVARKALHATRQGTRISAVTLIVAAATLVVAMATLLVTCAHT